MKYRYVRGEEILQRHGMPLTAETYVGGYRGLSDLENKISRLRAKIKKEESKLQLLLDERVRILREYGV